MNSADAAAFKFGVERHTLENGLRIFLLERPQLPIIAFTTLTRAGVVSEPPEKAGLSQFASSLLSQGTETRNAVQIAEEVDAMGASLGSHSDYDYSSVGLSCLSGDRERGLDILADVLTRPAFALEEVERKRNDILSALRRFHDDLLYLVRTRFQTRVFGDHPYRHPRLGYSETIAGIDREAILDFYDRHYRADNTVLAVVGNFDAGEMIGLLRGKLETWRPRSGPGTVLPSPSKTASVTVDRIQKDGVTQATLRIGSLGIERNNQDYVPLSLMNYVLGGSGFGSRLMQTLREERGLTYGVYSGFHTRRQPGYFFVGCQTGLETMNDALAGMFREVERMRDHGITQDELDWAKKYFTGSLPLTLETNDQLANLVLEQDLYQLEEEFWIKEIDQVRSASLEQVNEVADRYLHPEQFAVVALADFEGHELVVPGEATPSADPS